MKSYPDLQFETDSTPPPSPESVIVMETSDDTYHLSSDFSSSSSDSWRRDVSPDDLHSYVGLWDVVERGEALFDLEAPPRAGHRLLVTNQLRLCRVCRGKRATWTNLICDVCIVAVCSHAHLDEYHDRYDVVKEQPIAMRTRRQLARTNAIVDTDDEREARRPEPPTTSPSTSSSHDNYYGPSSLSLVEVSPDPNILVERRGPRTIRPPKKISKSTSPQPGRDTSPQPGPSGLQRRMPRKIRPPKKISKSTSPQPGRDTSPQPGPSGLQRRMPRTPPAKPDSDSESS